MGFFDIIKEGLGLQASPTMPPMDMNTTNVLNSLKKTAPAGSSLVKKPLSNNSAMNTLTANSPPLVKKAANSTGTMITGGGGRRKKSRKSRKYRKSRKTRK